MGPDSGATAAPRSHICIVDADGENERVIYATPEHFEAPNWSPDGTYLLLNSRGRLWRLPLAGGAEPEPVPTGAVTGINNDHGISPDGSRFAISAGPIYTLPAAGGEPRRVTEKTPSYFHGWSPDGRTLAYCAERNGVFNLYAIAADGAGEEVRLTFGAGYDDGPDYSPDGRWIYFNSNRTGIWCIWRIPAAGAGPGDARAEQITNDAYEDWFPHPSPDGRWLVFLSYPPGTQGHPPNRDIVLRRMPLPGDDRPARDPAEIRELAHHFGGQGTLNVNSWAPDSRRFAFVRYTAPPEA